MKRWGKQKPLHFDESELKTDLGSGNFIFIGSSCDLFAKDIPEEWIKKTLDHCDKYDSTYLFQTKNPESIRRLLPYKSRVCVTLETNRQYPEIMKDCPTPEDRFKQILLIRHPLYITVEPVMDFDLKPFVEMLLLCGAEQINIGADSGNNHLPEPSKEKLLALIDELKKFTVIDQKRNLGRLLK
jgi:DNA repair photolyase